MAVSGISAYSTQTTTLAELLTNAKNSSDKSANSSAAENLLSSGNNVTSGSSLSSYMLDNAENLKAIFDEIAKIVGGSVTFSNVKEYQEELQQQFNKAVKEDLQKMGVDPNVEFTLASDGEGGIKVLCDSATDKAMIEAYFDQNEDMVKAFNKLQTLSNLDKARKEQGYSAEELKNRIQLEGLAQWWSTEGTDYSQYMYFNQDTTLQFLGVSGKV